jgi:hypothetical protein
MASVDYYYSLIKYICNKNQSGAPSPSEVGRILTSACHQFTDFLLGQDNSYVPGRPQPRVGLGNSQRVRQSLSVLIGPPADLAIVDGRADYPEGHLYTDAMYKSDGYSKIRFVEQDKVQAYVQSVIDPIGENPIFLLESDGYLFYPATLTEAKVSYVKKHPDIVWNYEADDNGRPVYKAAGSAHPLFADTDMMEVIARALRMVGVNLQANHVAQFANEIKAGG